MAKADFGSLPKRTHSAGVRAIHTQDGRDIITGVESSWLQLEASSRGEDEALIAEIVKQKMIRPNWQRGSYLMTNYTLFNWMQM